ncbi:potassium channel family protein [bacterium]|nr:potassium channel family protein [bacterium]
MPTHKSKLSISNDSKSKSKKKKSSSIGNRIVPVDTDDIEVRIGCSTDEKVNLTQLSHQESKDLYNVFFESARVHTVHNVTSDSELKFKLTHKSALQPDRVVGSCDLSLSEIKAKESFRILDLKDEKKHTAGVLYVYISKVQNEVRVRIHSARQLKTEQQEEAEQSTESSSSDSKLLLVSCVLLLAYIIVGTLFYSQVDGALGDAVESGTNMERIANGYVCSSNIFSLSYINTHTHNSHRFYFTIVTLTTVGYGDMGATTDGTRLFTTFFVLFGIGFIGVALGIVASKFLDWEENAAKALAKIADDVHDTVKIEMDTMVDQSVKFLRAKSKKKKDENTNQQNDTTTTTATATTEHSFLESAEGQCMINILLLLAIIMLGTLFYYVESEDKSLIDCLYFATISGTTVGYGDESPSSISGRLVGSLYLLISVLTVAKTLGALADLPLSKRRARLKQIVLNRFGGTLSADELLELVHDFGGDDSRCSRSDFILGMLKRVGTVSKSDIEEAAKHFDQLDTDKSGVLGASDLTIATGDLADQVCGLTKDEQVSVLMHRLKEIEDVVDIEMKLLDDEEKKIKQQRLRLKDKIEMINTILHDDATLKRLRNMKNVDATFFDEDHVSSKEEDGDLDRPPGV